MNTKLLYLSPVLTAATIGLLAWAASAIQAAAGTVPQGGGTLLLLLAVYFLPAIFAASRKHHNTGAILVLNLFLGWTLLGWVIALIWASTNPAVVKVK